MINISYEMIKILHEKMLNAIYLYWFYNDTLEENNSLNGHSNEPWLAVNYFHKKGPWQIFDKVLNTRRILTFLRCVAQFGTICTIWKNVKNTRGGMLLFHVFNIV